MTLGQGYDCIVVGGGLIGMLCARELAREGAAVCLLERDRLGSEASWAGGGILSPLYPWRCPPAVTELVRWSQEHYPAFIERLRAETGVDPQWRKSGLLILELEEQRKAREWAARNRVALSVLDANELGRCEPAVAEGEPGAVWLPEVGQLRNPRLLRALKVGLARDDVKVVENREVGALCEKGGRITGVETREGTIFADRVVLAAGAWSARFLPTLRQLLEPVQGQMIAFEVPPGLLSRVVLRQGRYVIPRQDGVVLAGSTIERRGFYKSVTPEAREQLWRAAVRMIPALGDYRPVHHWAGLRPGSRSGVPFIGACPGRQGLFVNAGHFRNGVVTALASARLLADLVTGRDPIVMPDPYVILE